MVFQQTKLWMLTSKTRGYNTLSIMRDMGRSMMSGILAPKWPRWMPLTDGKTKMGWRSETHSIFSSGEECKSGLTDLQHYDKTTHLCCGLTLSGATTATHVAGTITLATSIATCSTGTTHQYYKSSPTDLKHYDKTTHPCHCLTPLVLAQPQNIAASTTTGDSTATDGTETIHQHADIDVCIVAHLFCCLTPLAPAQPPTVQKQFTNMQILMSAL